MLEYILKGSLRLQHENPTVIHRILQWDLNWMQGLAAGSGRVIRILRKLP